MTTRVLIVLLIPGEWLCGKPRHLIEIRSGAGEAGFGSIPNGLGRPKAVGHGLVNLQFWSKYPRNLGGNIIEIWPARLPTPDQDLWFQFEIGRACARGDASFGRVVRVDVGGESGLVPSLVSLGLHQIWCSSTKCWCHIGQCWPPPNMEKMVESDWRLSGQKCLDPTWFLLISASNYFASKKMLMHTQRQIIIGPLFRGACCTAMTRCCWVLKRWKLGSAKKRESGAGQPLAAGGLVSSLYPSGTLVSTRQRRQDTPSAAAADQWVLQHWKELPPGQLDQQHVW